MRRHRAAINITAGAMAVSLISITLLATFAAVALREQAETARRAQNEAQESSRQSGLLLARSARLGDRAELKAAAKQALIDAAKIRSGVDLRNEAIASMGRWQFQPVRSWNAQIAANMHSIDFSGDLSRFAEEVEDGVVAVRKTLDGSEECRLHPISVEKSAVVVSMLKLSPDGRHLAVVYRVRETRRPIFVLWNLETQREVYRDESTAWDQPPNFSPDGRWCARGTSTGNVIVYDLISPNAEPITLKLDRKANPRATVWEGSFSHDSNLLAIAVRHSGDIEIFDMTTHERVRRHSSPNWVTAIAWTPQDRELATGSRDGTITLRDAVSGQTVDSWKAHPSNVHALSVQAIDQDSTTAAMQPEEHDSSSRTSPPESALMSSYSWGGSLSVWDLTSRERVLDLRGSECKFSRDGRQFISRSGLKLTLWNINCDFTSRSLQVVRKASSEIMGTMFLANDRVLAGIGTDGLRLWEVETGRELVHLVKEWVCDIAVDESRQKLIVAARRELFEFPFAVSIEKDCSRLKIGTPLRSKLPSGYWITSMEQSLDGQVRALCARSAKDGFLRCWHLPSSEPLDQPILPIDGSLAISPRRDLIAFATRLADGPILQIRDAKTLALLHELPERAVRIAFHPTRPELVIAGRSKVRFLRIADWTTRLELSRDSADFAGQLTFDATGSIIAYSVTNHLVRLASVETGEELATFERPSYPERAEGIAFSRDGGWLAITYRYQSIEVWNLRRIREELRQMALDWNRPSLGPVQAASPVEIEIVAPE